MPKRVPSPEAIDEVDQALAWSSSFGLRDRRIYLGRLCNVPWRKIAELEGLTRQQCHNRLLACFETVAIIFLRDLTKRQKTDNFSSPLANSPAGDPRNGNTRARNLEKQI